MALIFTRTIRVPNATGTLTDADSTPTIGIIRMDTSAVVVASGTAMTHDSTGKYSYTIASPVEGVTYRATYVIVVNGQTISSASEKQAGDTSADWYYADRQAVEDVIGAEAVRLMSNEPGATTDTATDVERLQRVGEWSDQFIDARMSALGYVIPLANMSTGTAILFRQCSAELVCWKLNEPRMLASLSSGRTANAIDRVMEEHRKSASALLDKIATRQIAITADRTYTRQPYGKVYVPSWTDAIPPAAIVTIDV